MQSIGENVGPQTHSHTAGGTTTTLKTQWQNLAGVKMYMPYDPEISLLRIYSRHALIFVYRQQVQGEHSLCLKETMCP